jgi:hypothetical protein
MTRPTSALLVAATAALLLAADAPPTAAQAGSPRVLAFQELLKGTDEVSLRWPVAVAAASDDEVAVADAFGPRLLRFRRVGVSWQLDRTVALGGAPVGLAWDGRRYVASLRQGAGLVAFEGEALVQRPVPLPRGAVPGPLAATSGGELLVYDDAQRRVLRLSSEGKPAAEIGVAGQVTALAASPSGGFFAAIADEGSIVHFDASGKADTAWKLPASDEVPAWPSGLAAEPGGTLLVVDRHAGRLLALDALGQVAGVGSRQGWEPGLLLFPAGITRLPGGLVLVADEGNGRAQLFRRSGPGGAP